MYLHFFFAQSQPHFDFLAPQKVILKDQECTKNFFQICNKRYIKCMPGMQIYVNIVASISRTIGFLEKL
jgi:hypothetical protein